MHLALNKTKILIVALVVAVIILASFIGISYYTGAVVARDQAAATYGYQQAIFDVMNASANCQIVPLVAGNITIQLADVTCMQQALQQQQAQSSTT